jgi:predicted unusual protein kinase regulating ubiquinone biosynthesis (AarF/ABC1/UbiB family)
MWDSERADIRGKRPGVRLAARLDLSMMLLTAPMFQNLFHTCRRGELVSLCRVYEGDG